MYYDNLRILKLNPCLSNVLVYNNTYMHTHKPPFVCTILSISEKKTNSGCFIKKNSTEDAHIRTC